VKINILNKISYIKMSGIINHSISNTILYPLLKLPYKQQKKECLETAMRICIGDNDYIPQHLNYSRKKTIKKEK